MSEDPAAADVVAFPVQIVMDKKVQETGKVERSFTSNGVIHVVCEDSVEIRNVDLSEEQTKPTLRVRIDNCCQSFSRQAGKCWLCPLLVFATCALMSFALIKSLIEGLNNGDADKVGMSLLFLSFPTIVLICVRQSLRDVTSPRSGGRGERKMSIRARFYKHGATVVESPPPVVERAPMHSVGCAPLTALPSIESDIGSDIESARSACVSCSICLADYEEGDDIVIIPCKHIHHIHCLSRWLDQRQSCPMCKQSFSA